MEQKHLHNASHQARHQVSASAAESGSVTITTLFVLATIVFYASSGYQLVDADRNAEIHLPILVILCIVGCFAIGCAVHLTALGVRNHREIRHEVERDLDMLARLIDEAKLKIRHVENHSLTHFAGLSRRAQDAIAKARRIICSLETRYSDVKQLLSTGHKIDLLDAYESYHRKLVVAENSLTALIDSDPVPALSSDEWEPILGQLVATCEEELQKLQVVQTEFQNVA